MLARATTRAYGGVRASGGRLDRLEHHRVSDGTARILPSQCPTAKAAPRGAVRRPRPTGIRLHGEAGARSVWRASPNGWMALTWRRRRTAGFRRRVAARASSIALPVKPSRNDERERDVAICGPAAAGSDHSVRVDRPVRDHQHASGRDAVVGCPDRPWTPSIALGWVFPYAPDAGRFLRGKTAVAERARRGMTVAFVLSGGARLGAIRSGCCERSTSSPTSGSACGAAASSLAG